MQCSLLDRLSAFPHLVLKKDPRDLRDWFNPCSKDTPSCSKLYADVRFTCITFKMGECVIATSWDFPETVGEVR